MNGYYQHILLLVSIPIYGIIIPIEILLSHFYGWKFYSWRQTAINFYLNLLNAGIDILLRGVALAVLIFFSQYALANTLSPVFYWLFLFLMEDLFFWLEHFVDHRVRLFWAVHVTHHSSPEFNLSTGFRSSVLMPFYRYLYFVPIVLLGFRPMDILFMYAITQTYGILVHTQSIKRLPRWFELIFVAPAHHRVHHASNVPYLDKNMGMVLIVWDRVFGTFQEELEEEVPVFGLTKPLEHPNHPVKIVTHEWQAIVKDLKKGIGWRNKLGYLFRPPGWSHDGSSPTTKQLQRAWNADKKARNTEANDGTSTL
ncbi:MAG: sterol desaturase family protein [Bacteroidetes bacterium]|nr:sterol desaturase family protein [Bacteroidota bacterium]